MAAAAAATKSVTFKLPDSAEREPRSASAAISLPKTPHQRKLQEPSDPAVSQSPPAAPHETRRPQSVPARKLSPRPPENELRPQSRPSSEQGTVCLGEKQKGQSARAHVSSRVSRLRRDGRPVKTHRRVGASDTSRTIHAVREGTNSASRDCIRQLKYSVAKLREHLLKVEGEIKQMTRGKNTLELAVQDVRRAISVNQQSVSMQQKKTRVETDTTLHLLREEYHMLSRSKSSVEQHLRSVKCHLQTLDSTRRALQTKISTLSQALQLDAQNFKVYNGRREYVSACAAPETRDRPRHTEDSAAPLCSRAVEVLSASKKIRAGIEGVIVSLHSQKTQAHKTVTSAVVQSVQEADSKKREMLLERGQVRLSQNSAQHRHHTEEIMLGRVLGPVSDKHRSVSEKEDRPLSRLRPGSAVEERANIKRATRKLSKRLSASAMQTTKMGQVDQDLSRQLRQHSLSASLDIHTLRIRKMSLDNRWVQ